MDAISIHLKITHSAVFSCYYWGWEQKQLSKRIFGIGTVCYIFLNKISHDTQAFATQEHEKSAGTLTPVNITKCTLYSPKLLICKEAHHNDVGL